MLIGDVTSEVLEEDAAVIQREKNQGLTSATVCTWRRREMEAEFKY